MISVDLFSQEKGKFVLTSNLEGNFSSSIDKQEKEDRMILLGQSISREIKGGAFYFDLGNSFYPGILSRYSSGAVMDDFFKYFNCSGILVSSKDIRIGVQSLEFLMSKNRERYLSSNITRRNGERIFLPYRIISIKNRKVAFVALSAPKLFFDAAERKLYSVRVEDPLKSLETVLGELRSKSIGSIVVLSGLSQKENIAILNTHKDVGLVIGGGDNRGGLLSGSITRMDMDDGRSIITLPRSNGYYLLDVEFGETVSAKGLIHKNADYRKTDDDQYAEFVERLTIWKKHFLDDYGKPFDKSVKKEVLVDSTRISNLVRDRYGTEVAIIREWSINSFPLAEKSIIKDFMSSINVNYNIFTYRLSGADLVKAKERLDDCIFSGIVFRDGKPFIQGYQIDEKRLYSIASQQSVFEEIQQIIDSPLQGRNTWKNISDIAIDDINGEQVLSRDDYSYLERNFRATVDIFLSYFSEQSNVKKGDNVSAPADKPLKSFSNFGTEDRIDITIYNRYHRFVFTPYLNFAKQIVGGENIYIQNNLRGTFFYSYNTDFPVKPYHKSRIDTLLVKIEGLRPSTVRETIGADLGWKYLSGNIGLGFEKQINGPELKSIYGIESIVKFRYEIFPRLFYSLDIDSFFAYSKVNASDNRGYLRSQIDNGISYSLFESLNISLKHRWYYYYSMAVKQDYSNSQFIVSLDLKTDFKLY